ncbi:enoyl-CoA hydratase/isomerase family protein [Phycicoccus endophyticus]|uniref:Enoyl-CoA hydratase/isomerase family protein n=1 Tax=Phycicoccus endophyticus TaxID=1690220 RepID=A0A7G9R1Q2_9MICO|nr:enoyl-CoA hydratase-related protein [Phycicoccus endophyticus]NHI18681.1 crotonase [Phycicoccus endophyticus]QNN49527.1 enoyl-CoA hydratase/isomerase family protein [Phycicoccus endophyticus]GGL37293.1 enoyl-CoA hydratase [Phycicoccus endophyticus]
MSTARVRVEADGAIGRITLDAPERLNAVDPEMCEAVVEAVRTFDADPAVRVIALTGEGRGFCSGAPLTAEGAQLGVLEAGAELVTTVLGARTPVVALVHGVAAGIGVPIALACDYVLAADEAPFVLAFARIGLMPDGGATALVTAAVGRARAMRLAMSGEALPGATAAQWGLVAESVPAAGFADRAEELLAQLASGPTLALAETTAAVNAAALDLEAALTREDAGQRRLAATEDHREGAAAFVVKRAPSFRAR